MDEREHDEDAASDAEADEAVADEDEAVADEDADAEAVSDADEDEVVADEEAVSDADEDEADGDGDAEAVSDAGEDGALADEAAEEEDAADSMSRGAGVVPARPRPMWMTIAQLLLPPVLAAAAMGVHWWVNVPDKIVENPRDQGAKKKAKAKKKKGRRGRSKTDRKGQSARHQARTPEQIDQAWERYGSLPFDQEPTLPAWARRHQALINRAVVVARQHAFEGAPEKPRVVLSETKCRTIRCRFTLRSPYHHELDVITSSLARLQSSEQDVWRSYELGPIEPSEEERGGEPQQQVQVVVTFVTDETDTRNLAIPVTETETGEAEEALADAPRPSPSDARREG